MSHQKTTTPNRIGKLARVALRQIGSLLFYLGCARLVIGLTPWRTRALLYHAVEEQPSSYTRGLGVNVTPRTFGHHLDYFKRYYNVIAMSELLSGNARSRSLVITFDDGYASVEQNAVPQLLKRNLPATIYLIGRAVNGQMVWVNRLNQALNDHPAQAAEILAAYPELADLTHPDIINKIQTSYAPAQIDALIKNLESRISGLDNDTVKVFSDPIDIRAMQRHGIEFGFHTQDHYNLSQCSQSLLEQQLATSGLASLINSNTFAYPFGYFSGAAIDTLTHQGYEQLMTVGNNNKRFSVLHLDRSEVFETEHARVFAQLEIEEPIMASLRFVVTRLKAFVQLSPARPEKTPMPETSKPR